VNRSEEVSAVSERTSYAPGTPCWVDLGSPDTTATAEFYGGLFGWSATIDPRPEAGGYGMFSLGDRLVAGLGPQMTPGPPYWAVYVSVTDVDATSAAIAANGGEVLAGPMDVFDAGRLAAARDSVGTHISLWQPGEHIGAVLVNEPGTFTWNELATGDIAEARRFYTTVFGWGVAGASAVSGDPGGGSDGGGGGDAGAAVFTVDGEIVCGAHTAGPGEFPAWSVWFRVEDADASAARAEELGAGVLVAPSDMDFGRGAVLVDPQGATFGIGAMGPTATGGGS
jgi:hypothetical protein